MTKSKPRCQKCGSLLATFIQNATPISPIERRSKICMGCNVGSVEKISVEDTRENRFMDERDI